MIEIECRERVKRKSPAFFVSKNINIIINQSMEFVVSVYYSTLVCDKIENPRCMFVCVVIVVLVVVIES